MHLDQTFRFAIDASRVAIQSLARICVDGRIIAMSWAAAIGSRSNCVRIGKVW